MMIPTSAIPKPYAAPKPGTAASSSSNRVAGGGARCVTDTGERGAALVLALLITATIGVLIVALLKAAPLGTRTSVDQTTSVEARRASVSGIHAGLAVLRGHGTADPVSFERVGTNWLSNAEGDHNATARLSRWLKYDAEFPDRVLLSNPYSPTSGAAFSLEAGISPIYDDIAYMVDYRCEDGSKFMVYDYPEDNLRIVLDVRLAGTKVRRTSIGGRKHYFPDSGATDLDNNLKLFAECTRDDGQECPRMRERLEQVTLTQTFHLLSPNRGTVTQVARLQGQRVEYYGGVAWFESYWFVPSVPWAEVAGVRFHFFDLAVGHRGWWAPRTVDNDASATSEGIEQARPRLRLVSTGMGARGARAVSEAIIEKEFLDFDPPALVTVRSPDGSKARSISFGENQFFESADRLFPAHVVGGFAVTGETDYYAIEELAAAGGAPPRINSRGAAAVVLGTGDSFFPFLTHADAARSELIRLEEIARKQSRYTTSFSGEAGTPDHPLLTFVDGDCELSGGAGLLVVTGNLRFDTMRVADFSGIILVLGAGQINRDGGGAVNLNGTLVAGRFARRWLPEENGREHPFEPAQINFGGGGGAAGVMRYDSTAIRRALQTLGFSVRASRLL